MFSSFKCSTQSQPLLNITWNCWVFRVVCINSTNFPYALILINLQWFFSVCFLYLVIFVMHQNYHFHDLKHKHKLIALFCTLEITFVKLHHTKTRFYLLTVLLFIYFCVANKIKVNVWIRDRWISLYKLFSHIANLTCVKLIELISIQFFPYLQKINV